MRLRRDRGRTDAARGPRRARAGAGSSPRARTSARRPAPQRRRATAVDAGGPLRGRAGLTVRAAILAVAVASVALALALPLKVYLGQRSEISHLQKQTHDQQARVAALEEQQQRWADPAFIKAQARERLHFVLPGETAYIVLDAPRSGARAPGAAPGKAQPALDASRPWFSQVWRSVELAGRAPAPAKR